MAENGKDQTTALVLAPDVAPPTPTLVTSKPRLSEAFAPANLAEAMQLAKLMASSDLVTKEYRGKPGNVLIGMQYAAELGLPPLTALQNISIINGRACVWGDLFLAIIQTHPDYEWHKEWFEGAGDARAAFCEMKRKGHEVHRTSFSMADAKKARLLSKEGTWQTYPDVMLKNRSRGFCGRDKFSDALKGLVIREEAMDTPLPELQRPTRGTLDVGQQLASLSESSEPNRGHGNEGMEQAKPEPETPAVPAEPVREAEQPTASTGKRRGVVMFLRMEHKLKKPSAAAIEKAKEAGKDRPKEQVYFVVTCGDNTGLETPVFVWDEKLHEYLSGAIGKECDVELRVKEEAGVTRYALEHVHRIGDQAFVDDRPVPQAAEGQPTGGELFPQP